MVTALQLHLETAAPSHRSKDRTRNQPKCASAAALFPRWTVPQIARSSRDDPYRGTTPTGFVSGTEAVTRTRQASR